MTRLTRRLLALAAVSLIVGLGVLVSLTEIQGFLAIALFAVVLALVAFLAALAWWPDLAQDAEEFRISPLVLAAFAILAGLTLLVFRMALLR